MKKIKLFGTSFMTIISISLLTVGFSTWIVNSIYGTVTLDSNVGIIKETDIIKNTTDTKFFSVCQDGLVFDNTIVNEGLLDFRLSFDSTKAIDSNLLNENNEISYDVNLTFINLNGMLDTDIFLNHCIYQNNSLTEINGSALNLGTLGKETYYSRVTLKINPAEKTHKFSLQYKFKSAVYNFIKTGKVFPKFKLVLEIASNEEGV